MSALEIGEAPKDGQTLAGKPVKEGVFRHILACVDTSAFSHATLAHASAIAAKMDARLTVLRVLEPAAGSLTPTDPVEWTLRHRDTEAEVRRLAAQFGNVRTTAAVADGLAAERICAWARDHRADLTVLGTGGDSHWPFAGLGSTARRVAEACKGSVLLVPAAGAGDRPIRYRRVMTPLDGSSRSECALPIAAGIAIAHEAEIILVHAAPNIELTEIGPLEAEALALRDQLRQRNERIAEQYLQRVRSRLPSAQVSMRTRVLVDGDPRHALARAAEEHHADIVVLSSTGLSGHSDLSVGSVADYLINHIDKPILLVRGQEWQPLRIQRYAERAQAVRLPNRALM
jgi:nucleotide-binding universal stress UspA family protein